jgi:hypothetical protein
MVKKDEDGTTSGAKKIPLILKDFFSIKPVDNHISMTYNIKSHEDGLSGHFFEVLWNQELVLETVSQLIFLG